MVACKHLKHTLGNKSGKKEAGGSGRTEEQSDEKIDVDQWGGEASAFPLKLPVMSEEGGCIIKARGKRPRMLFLFLPRVIELRQRF